MKEICITIPELSKLLHISRNAAYNLAKAPDFYPAFRIGKRVLVRVDALEKWLDEQTAPCCRS